MPTRKNSNHKKRSPQDIDAEVGNIIRAHRIERGMSQNDLGKKLGVSFQQIQKYERGTNRIGIGRLIQTAELFKVSVHDLIGQGNVAPVSVPLNGAAFKLAEEFNDLDPDIATMFRHVIARIKAPKKK